MPDPLALLPTDDCDWFELGSVCAGDQEQFSVQFEYVDGCEMTDLFQPTGKLLVLPGPMDEDELLVALELLLSAVVLVLGVLAFANGVSRIGEQVGLMQG